MATKPLFFAVVVVDRVGADQSGLGRFNEPFIAVRIITGLAPRIVRDNQNDKIRRIVIGNLVRFARSKNEGVLLL